MTSMGKVAGPALTPGGQIGARPYRRRPGLSEAALAARAAYVLRGNDRGSMTRAAPSLYPHMWSWDAAFVAVGLASVNLDRAVRELDTLFAAQWKTGMLPHIVFAPNSPGYFPGPERWRCAESGAPVADGAPATSGICQPPVHAIAVQRIAAGGRRGGRGDRQVAEDFVHRIWPKLMAWHRWLALRRDPEGTGLVSLCHGWESGMDNSPRWDGPYSRVRVGDDLPPYSRLDNEVVTDETQRPSDADYDRYMWLVEQMRRVGYDDELVRKNVDFAVADVFFSALLALASDVLAELGEEHRMPAADIEELYDWSRRFQRGVAGTVDAESGLARDRDLRADRWLGAHTVAGFAPLLCGGLERPAERRLLALLDSPRWSGHPDLVAAVPPSTSPNDPAFRPRQYWRGPQWPVIAWLLSWAFARRGWADRAEQLREEGMRLVGDGLFAEYYEPFTGEPLGSMRQSWTAAIVLDWLC
jgi:hypothetical protein